jgi:hypothetical protein
MVVMAVFVGGIRCKEHVQHCPSYGVKLDMLEGKWLAH